MKRELHLLAVLTAVIAIVHTSCVKKRSIASDPSHKTGEPTRGSFPLQWVTEDIPDYFQKRLKRDLSIDPNDVLPVDHALTRRIQYWIDHFHGVMVARHPEFLKNTPKPNAAVVKKDSLNAFVFRQIQCRNVEIKREGATDQSLVEQSNAFHIQFPGKPSRMPVDEYECTDISPQDLKSLVDLFNRSVEKCRFKADGKSIIASPDCFADADFNETDKFTRLSWTAEANFVFVNTGAFAKVQHESDLVAIIAHELGHYYRTHNISFYDKIGFFYKRGDKNVPDRPLVDDSLTALAAQVVEAYGFPYYTKIPGQSLHTALLSLSSLDLSTSPYCTEGACVKACKDIKKTSDSIDLARFTKPDYLPSAEDQKQYLDLEKRLISCIAVLPFDESKVTTFKSIIAASMSNMVPLLIPDTTDMKTALMEFNRQVTEKEQGADKVFQEAAKIKLGFYTHEQEADEISLELLANAGIKPDLAYGAYLSLLKSTDRRAILGEFTRQQCETYFANGWKDSNGRPIDVPVGAWKNAHHSLCFRIFNLTKEVETHEYAVTPGGAALLSDAEWKDLQTQATSLGAAAGNDHWLEYSDVLKRRQALDTCEFARDMRGE